MSTSTVPADVERYLRRVRERLADLPAEEREDLLADVEPSVLESAGDSDAPVELRLGPPERFADELRAAAGLPPRAEATAPRRSLRDRLRAAAADPRLRATAPLWWLAAAYVTVAVVHADPGAPVLLAVLACAVAVAATLLRRPLRGAAVVLALVLLPLIAYVAGRPAVLVSSSPVIPQGEGLTYGGLPVDNVFAYDRRGRPLQDVRLYDSTGQPLALHPGDPDPERRVPRSGDGERAFNAFPVRYFEPGTKRVARPRAGVPEAPPPLVTPPVR